MAHFVFMLTHGDRTVDNAAEIMPTLADTGLKLRRVQRRRCGHRPTT